MILNVKNSEKICKLFILLLLNRTIYHMRQILTRYNYELRCIMYTAKLNYFLIM